MIGAGAAAIRAGRPATARAYRALPSEVRCRRWLVAHAERPVPGFYLVDDADDIDQSRGYCRAHADAVCRRIVAARRRRGSKQLLWNAPAWSGDDRLHRCSIATCAVPLDNGGLTDWGLRDILALEVDEPAYTAEPDALRLADRGIRDCDINLRAAWVRHAARNMAARAIMGDAPRGRQGVQA